MNTFETTYSRADAQDSTVRSINIDADFSQKRIQAYKKMFPDHVPLGWYSVKGETGADPEHDKPTPEDLSIMKAQVRDICENPNPIVMIMNPNSQTARDAKRMPFFLY